MKWEFSVTPKTDRYCQEIVRCMGLYGDLPSDVAVVMINEFWKEDGEFGNDDFRLHEDPYYWAMSMVHRERAIAEGIDWCKDPKYYPPPSDWQARWYGESE
ncbi:hypothetical protein OAU50_04380 [Planctomycetota bacterium]|nr:hypothetical protein [Planctomycetota bacterium]